MKNPSTRRGFEARGELSLECHKEPVMRWYPELEAEGIGKIYNMVSLGEGANCQWFMLEFCDSGMPRNPAWLRLRARRIHVREDWFADEHEKLSDYVRRKAREWGSEPRGAPDA